MRGLSRVSGLGLVSKPRPELFLVRGRPRHCPWTRRSLGSELVLVFGGSWVVIGGFISGVPIIILHIQGLIIPLIITHEPPSRTRV